MEYNSYLGRGSVVHKTSKIIQTKPEAAAIQNMKLQERFQMDAKLSYADFHHSITQNIENIPSGGSSDNERNPRIEMYSNDDDELLKYMSTLPAFLRKAENIPEKAFRVGVLNWGRLEKWKSSHKQMFPRYTRYSTACSTAFSAFSADSLSNSSRGRSCSPIQQRMNRPTRQSHLLASPKGGYPHPFDPLSDNREKFTHNVDVRQHKFHGKLLAVETVKFQNNEAVSCNGSHPAEVSGEDEKKVLESKLGSRSELFQVARCPVTEPEIEEKPNNVVILVPRDVSKTDVSESAFTQLSDSRAKAGKKPVEMSRRGRAENVRGGRAENVRGVRCSKFHSEIPSPAFSEYNLREQPQMKCHGSVDAANLKSEGPRQLTPFTRVGVSQSTVGTLQTRKPNALAPALDARLLRSSDFNANTSSEKPRSSSPLRRLGHSLTKIVKNSSSKDGYSGTHYDSRRSGCEKAEAVGCEDMSVHDRSNSAVRSRSSPLRRLLDPILKPKTPDSHNCDSTFPRSFISNDRQAESMNLQSPKTKLDIAGCRTLHVDEDLNWNKRFELVAVQALLRVASKNGLPLFTFAVDNKSGILAATMKNGHSSGKDDPGWVYTFFTIHEVRKKNGNWITQGAKTKAPNYVPNAVAHMKVSDVELQTSQHLEEHSSILREFVLLGIDTAQREQSTPDFQPHDELAAIVTKTPVPERQFQCQFTGVCDPFTPAHLKDQRSLGSGESKNTTVILPSGIHSLPISGGPSSLIERWRSGGSCDCGGWDVGCKLLILSSNDHLGRKLSSAEASSSEDSFSLFSQACPMADAQREEQPVFSLTPFKDKIYSVEFKSSLSVLQAFSICIAVLDSRKLIGSLETSNLCEVKPHDKVSQHHDGGMKLPEHAKADASPSSTKYAAYPPLSPVGRV